MLSQRQKKKMDSPGEFFRTVLLRFCLGSVAAMLLYLQAGWTEQRFLFVVCLLLLPAAGTTYWEKKETAPALFYGGELLLLLVAYVPEAITWLTGQVKLAEGSFLGRHLGETVSVLGSSYMAAERNSLLLGSLLIVLPSMLSAGGIRRNLLDRPLAAEGLLFLVAYLWAIWSEAGYGYRFFLYTLAVAFLMLYFYQKNQYGRRLFLEAAGSQADGEQEEYARQINRKSLFPFLLLVLLVSALAWIPMGSQALTEAVQEQYSKAMEGVNEWMTGMPEDFSGLFGEPAEGEESEKKTEEKEGEALPAPVQKESDLWLLKTLVQGAMIALVLLSAMVLFLVLRSIAEKQERKSQNEMQQEYELTITETSTRLEKKRSFRRRLLEKEPEKRRIRQLYRETLRRSLPPERSRPSYQTMTPEELEYRSGLRVKTAGKENFKRESIKRESLKREDLKRERIERKTMESGTIGNVQPLEVEKVLGLEKLHQLYEKARYGKEACTKEEQRQAEEAAKQLSS